jgi:transposase InsO family protein
MREDNLLCVRRRRFVITTDSNHDRRIYPHLARELVLTGVNRRRCGTAVGFEWVEPLTESDEIEHIGYDPDFMDAVRQRVAKAG